MQVLRQTKLAEPMKNGVASKRRMWWLSEAPARGPRVWCYWVNDVYTASAAAAAAATQRTETPDSPYSKSTDRQVSIHVYIH